MKRLLAFIIVAALAGSQVVAAEEKRQSLADHEAAAAVMSFKEAVVKQNELIKAGEIYDVIPYTRRAYALIKAAATKNPKYQAQYEQLAVHYGNTLIGARKLEEAQLVLSNTLEEFTRHYGEDALELVDPLMALGMAKVDFRGSSSNNQYFDRALELARKHEGDNSPLVGKLYYKISEASLVYSSGDWRKAQRKLKKAHEILVTELGRDSEDAAISAYRIGELSVVRKKYKEAVPFLEDAASVLDNSAPNRRLTQRIHELLVKSYSNMGMNDQATKHCKQVGKIKEANGDATEEGLGYMPIYRIHPNYPRLAQRRGDEGQVVLEITVTKNGTPGDIRVLSNEGPKSFVNASVKAMEKFRYAARHVDGEPVDTKGVQYKFSYYLAN